MIARMSLHQRVIAASLAVLAVVLVVMNVVAWAAFRATSRDDTQQLLEARVALAEVLARSVSAGELDAELAARGIPAEIRGRAGASGDRGGSGDEPGSALQPPEGVLAESVVLEDGREIVVYGSTGTADAARGSMQNVLLGASVGGILLAALLLIRASRAALGRLEDVVAAARSVAEGEQWARLEASSPQTEVGRLEVALDDMVDVLERSLDEARLTNARTQRFLADAAHQLRTPLTGIRASAELLAMQPGADDAARVLANLVDDCERLTRLVSALLRMARIDQGWIAAPVPSDLVAICREQLRRASLLAPHVAFELRVPEPAPQPIDLDPVSLAEALSNLVENAGRHALSTVVVQIAADGPTLVISLEDDGAGMDAATAARAFERFSTFDACGGVGLGLPIARGIFEAHGGSLEYESGRFVARLPRERRRHPRAAEGAGRPMLAGVGR